jgi:hypothetical protein
MVPAAGPTKASAALAGRGFPPRTRTVVRVGGRALVTVPTDARGTFTASVVIPKTRNRVIHLVSRSRARRVVNIYEVKRARASHVGEVAAGGGPRLRWSPLQGLPGTAVTVALRRFPPEQRVFVRFGRKRPAGGRTSRRGRATFRLKAPNGRPGRVFATVRAGGQALRFGFLLTATAGGSGGTVGPPAVGALPRYALEDVVSATGYRYGAHDNLGNTLDTLKVIPSPSAGYLGVYHTLSGGVFVTKLAQSADLLTWTHVVDLDSHASQPTIAALSDGGFLVAYEKDAGCTGTGPNGNCLAFRHYASLATLLAGGYDTSFQAPRTLSNCAEGTPNIYGSDLAPDIYHSTIDVGFHFFRNCDVDRQARGTLRNFSSWTATVAGGLNQALEAFQPRGNIGDRDNVRFGGGSYNLHEVQFVKGDFGSWRVYLYDWSTGLASPLAIHTHRGSTAFANPTITSLLSPAGRPALVTTLFVPSQGAAPGEGGELIYYRELP